MTTYLIDFKDDVSEESIASYLADNKCTKIGTFKKLTNVQHVQADNEPPTSEIVRLVQNDDLDVINLLTVVPVTRTLPSGNTEVTVNDETHWWKLYSMLGADLSATGIDIPIYGRGTNVYVMDSGIDVAHPEFANRDISLLYSFVPDDFGDTDGHGTAISSIIVGNTCGITDASLKVVKIFQDNTPTRQSDMLYAFDAILHDAAISTNKFSVVNLSWSIPRNTYIEDKIRQLTSAGIAVVAAAGNSGIPINDATPAAISEVFTIGSYGVNFVPSDFTNYTDPSIISFSAGQVNEGELDSWAPGEKIWVAQPGGGYGFAAGTSIAAAIYTASIAYDASQLLLSSGDLMAVFKDTTGSMVNWTNLSARDRVGLLDLSNPKYTTSANKICSFYDYRMTAPASRVRGEMAPVTIVVTVGETVIHPFFDPMITTSYEILTPLPDWVTIEKHTLILKPVVDPVSPFGVDVCDFKLNVTFDNDISSEVTLTLVTTSKTFDRTALPPGDPLLEIILTAVTCFAGSYPSCSGKSCGANVLICIADTTHKRCYCG